MVYPDNLEDNREDKEIADFFTFRPGQPDYVDGPQREDHWAWLENYPQHGYIPSKDGSYEQVAVGVAQNAGPSTDGHCSAFRSEERRVGKERSAAITQSRHERQ